MRRKSSFQPTLADPLEERMLLSRGGLKVPAAHVIKPPAVAPVTSINAAFDSFVTDYTQARAVYLSTVGPNGVDTSTTAFQNYSHLRVDLLAQQLTSILVKAYSNATKGGHGNRSLWNDFAALVPARVSGAAARGTVTPLRVALDNATPPATAVPAVAALDSLAQDQAIGSARIAVINGYNFSKAGQNKSGHK